MFSPGQTAGVAVSGGADSVCLLFALRELAPRWGIALAVLHLDHGLRGEESRGDAEFVRRLALELGLPVTMESRPRCRWLGAGRQSGAGGPARRGWSFSASHGGRAPGPGGAGPYPLGPGGNRALPLPAWSGHRRAGRHSAGDRRRHCPAAARTGAATRWSSSCATAASPGARIPATPARVRPQPHPPQPAAATQGSGIRLSKRRWPTPPIGRWRRRPGGGRNRPPGRGAA